MGVKQFLPVVAALWLNENAFSTKASVLCSLALVLLRALLLSASPSTRGLEGWGRLECDEFLLALLDELLATQLNLDF